MMRWGLVPIWAKDMKIGYKLINARAETVFDKPMWRNVIKRKRALIPASGFYEWKKDDQAGKPHKTPYYIHPKTMELFAFAGLWEVWHDAEGKEWKTYTIITTEPNKEMSGLHDRMPVILHPEDELPWLRAGDTKEDIEKFLLPYEDNGLEIYEVSDEVNSPQNNRPDY
jgi:putative SOS response-associated peptidase YedK